MKHPGNLFVRLMPPRTVGGRPRHNPRQLRCPFPSCHRSFRNQSGLTNHIRSTYHQNSERPKAPTNANDLEAPNTLAIHVSDASSSQGNQDPTPQSTPPRFSPSFSPIRDEDAFSRIRSDTPKGDEPISKIFHPVINGLYSLACHDLTFFINYIIFQGILATNMATTCQKIHLLLLDILTLIQKIGHHTKIGWNSKPHSLFFPRQRCPRETSIPFSIFGPRLY